MTRSLSAVRGRVIAAISEGLSTREAARRFRPLVKDPLAIFRRIATDLDSTIDAPEGPLHPKGPLPEEKVREEEDT